MLKTIPIIIFILLFLSTNLAQPDLRIEPRNIVFENIFNRIDSAIVYNRGNEPLRIDSLSSANPFYIVSFEGGLVTPFFIQPNDTITATILLSNFYNITVSDTVDTLWFYSNDPGGPRDLRIKIDFFDDDDRGICSGIISDEQQNPLADVKIYFLYWGIYIIDSTSTDSNGNYSSLLPKGAYTIAAEKDGYQTTFYGSTADPYLAYPVDIDSGQIVNLNLSLPFIGNTGYVITGRLVDSVGNVLVNKGVVVIRKGTHTPTLLKGKAALIDSSVYSAFVRSDGTYSITVRDTAYYYVQGFSDYYLPSFYNDEGLPAIYWQDADSVLVNQLIYDKNIVMKRDSSYGGGNAFGSVTFPFTFSYDFDGVSVYAKSIDNGALYSYNFVKQDGKFRVSNLPYGRYQMIAQKIGFPISSSEPFIIDSINQDVTNLSIIFNTSSNEDGIKSPQSIELYQNYPNPFNPTTKIRFTIPALTPSHSQRERVILRVYDILGNEITTLVNEEKEAGYYEVEFNAEQLSSGIYFYRLQSGSPSTGSGQSYIQTKKMLLLR
ncbi:carboxypeptidase regulatory-like domain-containing protein [Ignavibacterium album]|uniref:carboxypeptidase regulatory-like domain-containing protein n=1 Tax=Ignavibacterium album TaxID=591197 RepID=UPI0026E9FDF2|nr:carboxypeptidase regulatory-like domain-containing protein [Ignavibacterium album]